MKPMWIASVLALTLVASRAQMSNNFTGCQFTSWYSEEQGYHFTKLDGYPMTGLMCQGYFCDDLRAKQCTHFTNGARNVDLQVVVSTCGEPVPSFSAGMGQCPDGQYVESIKCGGHFCTSILLKCCQPVEWVVDTYQSLETAWFGNLGGEMCPLTHVVIGARCKGWFCAEMNLICAPIMLHSNSVTSSK